VGNVDIIACGKLRSAYELDKGPWGILLPRRRIHVAAKRHEDLFRSQAGKTAAMLQLCIDNAMERVPTASLEHA
jgi:hypothetical protein